MKTKQFFTDMICKLYAETYPNATPLAKFYVSKSRYEMMMVTENEEELHVIMNVGGSDNPKKKVFVINDYGITEDNVLTLTTETMTDRLLEFYNKFYK
jgi:hypothetical protein